MPRAARKTTRRTKPEATPRIDPAQAITEEIISPMEAETAPWQQPRRSISVFWMTVKPAKDFGAIARKGERSSLLIYSGTVKAKGTEGGDAPPPRGRLFPIRRRRPSGGERIRVLQSYRIFDAPQIDALARPLEQPKPTPSQTALAET